MMSVRSFRLRWLACLLRAPAFKDARRFGALERQDGPRKRIAVHMLWVAGDLSPLEMLSCASFVQNGYDVMLWSYGAPREVPDGVRLRDAREILPEDRLFLVRKSHAGFSNHFRYAVLSREGGLWADMDVVCLIPADELQARLPGGFIVTEHTRSARRRQLNSNLIYCPHPKRGDVVDLALALAERVDLGKLVWGDIGPRLLTMLAQNYPAFMPTVMAPDFANPFPYWKCPAVLLARGGQLPREACFVHCYNERWRRCGVDKTAPWPVDSIMGRLALRYRPGAA